MSANAPEVGDGAVSPEPCPHAGPPPATPTPAPTVATALMKPRRPSRPISAEVISRTNGSVIVTSVVPSARRAKLPKACNGDVARALGLDRPPLPVPLLLPLQMGFARPEEYQAVTWPCTAVRRPRERPHTPRSESMRRARHRLDRRSAPWCARSVALGDTKPLQGSRLDELGRPNGKVSRYPAVFESVVFVPSVR